MKVFYLCHLRTSGRSLDSPRRCGAQAAFADKCEWDDWLDTLEFDDDIMSEIQARDIYFVLVNRLAPMDKIILGELAEGLGVRDIAEKLQLSHMFVVRHRRRIARLAIKLGINPPAASPLQGVYSEKSNPAEA